VQEVVFVWDPFGTHAVNVQNKNQLLSLKVVHSLPMWQVPEVGPTLLLVLEWVK